MDRVRISKFIDKKECYNLNTEGSSVDVVSQEEHLFVLRGTVFFQYVQ